jgi:hypothetical protein
MYKVPTHTKYVQSRRATDEREDSNGPSINASSISWKESS